MTTAEPKRGGADGRRLASSDLEAWFVTGSQHLYGEAVLRRSTRTPGTSPAASTRRRPCRSGRRQAGRHDARGDRRGPARGRRRPACIGVVAWMHTFSPAKMWIGGLTDLRKPLVHLHTQYNRDLPWADIDMDFMNLNQAAHGDREFAFIQTRLRRGRKTIVGHWEDPAVTAAGWAGGRGRRPAGTRHAGSRSPGSATTCARSRSPRATRSRRRRGSGSRSTATASTSWSSGWPRSTTRRSTTSSTSTRRLRRGDAAPPERRPPRRAADGGPRSRPACGRSSMRAASALHRHVRGPRRARAAARHRRPAADGRRLRLRRRGRLEGRRARPDPQGHGRGAARRHLVHGGLHLPPRRSGAGGPRRPHARGLPVADDRPQPSCEIHPLSIGGRSDPVRLVFDAHRARRSSSASPTSATGSG